MSEDIRTLKENDTYKDINPNTQTEETFVVTKVITNKSGQVVAVNSICEGGGI